MAPASTTLIFPAVNSAARDYLKAARARQERVLCAASASADGVASEDAQVLELPSIYDAGFDEAFLRLQRDHRIERIYCPISTVHVFMRRWIAAHDVPLVLLGESPVAEEMARHRELMQRADRALDLIVALRAGGSTLARVEVAALLKFSSSIYGESNDDKLAAMMAIAASAPRGDVVEIGSLMGRSAFVMLHLARRFELGTVLTVDPWSPVECHQGDSPAGLQAVVDEWDYELLAEGFAVSTALCPGHRHLRQPAHEAYAVYRERAGGAGQWEGRIGLIHIDGNHDKHAVAQDCRLWLPRLVEGGWLVLDDYVWAHGDGPREVGDRLLAQFSARILHAFVCGKALFIRWRQAPAISPDWSGD